MTFLDELAEFRSTWRAWIAQNVPRGLEDVFDWRLPRIVGRRDEERRRALAHPLVVEWEQVFLADRLVCASWPERSGGRGWLRWQKAVFEQELHHAGVPKIDRDLGESLLGPTVIAWGTEEQQARLLPPIISGQDVYCQGFSEPDHGSDLANLRTRGVVEGDSLVVTGQKIWTTHAPDANRMFVLCRTDPDVSLRHRGLTFAVIDFGEDNGVEVRPIRQMSGPAEFGEVFLNDARAALTDLVGGIGNGWRVAMTTLSEERDFNITTLALQNEHEFAVLTADLLGPDSDPVTRSVLAGEYARTFALRCLASRILGDPGATGTDAVAAVIKLYWSETHRALAETVAGMTGPDLAVRPDGPGFGTTDLQDTLLASQAETIFAGTSEIQRNLIAERLLGLPR